jgi:CRP-like cAMP-binding protein
MTSGTTDVDVRTTLERCELLEPLSERQIDALAGNSKIVTLKEGEPLLDKDALANSLFAVADGRVSIRLGMPSGGVLETFEAGIYTLHGWLSLVDNHLYVAEASALQDSTVLVLSTEDVEAVLLSEPQAAYEVMKKIAGLISARHRGMKEGFMEVLESSQGSWGTS